ncbi:phosphocholine-specific phospholipase C [Siphonobacter aquaeclarae]|uniref:phospholipase C n=1 Tax=Siphonobacter aquaeclarae TaxID=563176 RepID=A0A1G9IKA4_9BACT|nr:phospholipase C, phosphocholine-specific [Siphonobacter aquaeclarae]SDL25284.1 phospholipase C [Siphonobacter aquaeclarae]
MHHPRRDFLKQAAILSGTAGLSGLLPESVQKAFAINPEAGTTYLDAEHVVILMQENRSFDHAYGTLQGVRGYSDPRAILLPNGRKVWFQANAEGRTYAPYRLNIRDTKATWMSALPHSWENQVDARNNGRYDGWLDAKKSGNPEYAQLPLTLGHYNREDLPFYYALADAFTVCDQNFCSSLTGTTPNRLYLWTGTIRDPRKPEAIANVRNENVDYTAEVDWTTFPERVEDLGVSWKIYQNEISLPCGFEGEEYGWLSNFTDNPIEWFSQYKVKFHAPYYRFIEKYSKVVPENIQRLEKKLAGLTESDREYKETQRALLQQKKWQETITADLVTYAPANYERLSQREKNIHEKAFTTNTGDADYHQLASITYDDNGTRREMKVPKGDVLHQFREDVKTGKLPTVSWVVAPEKFSDHPSVPWYGAWYISEMLDILTSKPDVWKKTIFILAYDENDGYFDHVPPFVPPHPDKPETGKISAGIDTRTEFVTAEQEAGRPNGRTGPIGLGFRVPLVIASPWSRGGFVNSEVFDHTSVLRLLENFLSHKTGKTVRETNISDWRREICGDLSSVFRPYNGEKIGLPASVDRDPFLAGIHQAQFRRLPTDFHSFSEEDFKTGKAASYLPKQEKGIRASCALPYELSAHGERKDGGVFVHFESAGASAPFAVYDIKANANRHYTVRKGDRLSDGWNTDAELHVYGPNGFFRSFAGLLPVLDVRCYYQKDGKGRPTGALVLKLKNTGDPIALELVHLAYGYKNQSFTLKKGEEKTLVLKLSDSHHWYDFRIQSKQIPAYSQQFAGRVETGSHGFTDPQLGS